MVKEYFFFAKLSFYFGIPLARYVYNWFHYSNYCKGGLNGFVHETDKKFNTLYIPRGLQSTFIHFVMMDPRKWNSK